MVWSTNQCFLAGRTIGDPRWSLFRGSFRQLCHPAKLAISSYRSVLRSLPGPLQLTAIGCPLILKRRLREHLQSVCWVRLSSASSGSGARSTFEVCGCWGRSGNTAGLAYDRRASPSARVGRDGVYRARLQPRVAGYQIPPSGRAVGPQRRWSRASAILRARCRCARYGLLPLRPGRSTCRLWSRGRQQSLLPVRVCSQSPGRSGCCR